MRERAHHPSSRYSLKNGECTRARGAAGDGGGARDGPNVQGLMLTAGAHPEGSFTRVRVFEEDLERDGEGDGGWRPETRKKCARVTRARANGCAAQGRSEGCGRSGTEPGTGRREIEGVFGVREDAWARLAWQLARTPHSLLCVLSCPPELLLLKPTARVRNRRTLSPRIAIRGALSITSPTLLDHSPPTPHPHG